MNRKILFSAVFAVLVSLAFGSSASAQCFPPVYGHRAPVRVYGRVPLPPPPRVYGYGYGGPRVAIVVRPRVYRNYPGQYRYRRYAPAPQYRRGNGQQYRSQDNGYRKNEDYKDDRNYNENDGGYQDDIYHNGKGSDSQNDSYDENDNYN